VPSPSPTVPQRRLARALRRLRADADLTIEQVAEKVDLSASTLSRLETAQAVVRRGDIKELLDIYGVTDAAQHQKLMRLAIQSREQPWWHEYRDLPETAGADLEAQADVIRQYSVLLVPGLLQTQAYARAVMRAVRGSDSENFERHLRLRMDRQAVLTKQESPEYVVVLDEPVVRRVVGDRQVMREQLRRLTETAALPSVSLKLLPLSVGAHAAMDGEFTLYSYQKDPDVVYDDPDVVYVEDIEGGRYIESSRVTRRYNQVFDRLLDMAWDPVKSAKVLADIERELASTERG
jgi:transcriptional regulator with XRE-family HTH domain